MILALVLLRSRLVAGYAHRRIAKHRLAEAGEDSLMVEHMQVVAVLSRLPVLRKRVLEHTLAAEE